MQLSHIQKSLNGCKLFFNSIDETVLHMLRRKKSDLTRNLILLQWKLWYEYKDYNGCSAGTQGIAEYIVFSAMKQFIERCNPKLSFSPKGTAGEIKQFILSKSDNKKKIAA